VLEASDGALDGPLTYDTTPGEPIPYRCPYMHGRASQPQAHTFSPGRMEVGVSLMTFVRPASSASSVARKLTYGRLVTRWPIEIALARNPALLLAWLGLRLFIAEIALIVGLESTGTIRLTVLAVSAVVLVYALLLAVHALSLRLLIFPEEMEVSSYLLRRRYRLEPGDATRHEVSPKRGAFKSQLGNFGIELGRGRMPSGEPVDIVRLAPLPSAIVIQCASILLAVAPSSERALLTALDKARLTRSEVAKGIQH
jgi:hypothetical protein